MWSALGHYVVSLLGRRLPSARIPINQMGKPGSCDVTVRTPHPARPLLPRLTARRYIDLVRTSSAICQPA
ncbi:putative leader peptide [Streptomyces sp. NPDC002082]|uniref:putative leader peptide n=1 Tax=Streptomyces sp. NPDC002082 TaxID=3154772 RepID=UPI00332DA249